VSFPFQPRRLFEFNLARLDCQAQPARPVLILASCLSFLSVPLGSL